MKLAGHREITEQAVKEFIAEFKRDSGSQLRYSEFDPEFGTIEYGPEKYAVLRDIFDVFSLGHWSNFAQKHHFMRRFDGQSPYGAYVDACNWIKSNSIEFANSAARGSGSYNLAPLGYACHCVEDSFAHGHCVREPAKSDTQPGAITHVKMYAGKEKDNHSHHDETWKNEKTGKLSSVKDKTNDPNDKHYGLLAKNAVKALFYVVFHEVYVARTNKKKISNLSRWTNYQNKWLAASPKLSRDKDKAYDMIDKRYDGFVWGNTNTALNFDEPGLANDIYSKLKTNTNEIYNVFHRLNEHHTVDADDVAEIYVNRLQKDGDKGAITAAVGKDRRLCNLLIKILDEGWTTSDEYKCIDFLKKIRG